MFKYAFLGLLACFLLVCQYKLWHYSTFPKCDVFFLHAVLLSPNVNKPVPTPHFLANHIYFILGSLIVLLFNIGEH